MVPALGSNVSPVGMDPDVMFQVYGLVPLIAVRVTVLYAALTVPLGNVGAVLMLGPAMTLIENDFVSEPPRESVTRTSKLNGPELVGVPLIAPVDPLMLSPGGSDVWLASDQLFPPLPPDALS